MSEPSKDASVIERATKVIYDSMVNQARLLATERDLQEERLRRVILAAAEESDRSAAILMFALAEDLMLEGLRDHFNPRAWGNGKDIIGPNGLLGTAANRLSLLELLWWIRESTAADLRRLKAIRNHFAHHPDVASFNDQKISAIIGQLHRWERPVAAEFNLEKAESELSNRGKFLLRSSCTLLQLACDLTVGPAASRYGVNPADVEGTQAQNMIEGVRKARLLMAEIILKALNFPNLAQA